ncbi:MAG: nitrite/sulfite reductase [Myxococcales bacterium]|nr:nitrite/sulfite reductase [Myxococcales bacterium]
MVGSWKERLHDRMPAPLAEEIDVFETQIEMRKQGKLDEKVFAETRLRRGAYGQRYDNGQRHDGVRARTLEFPSNDVHKGPDTKWDAPGMMRIKIPFGYLNAEQVELLADISEEYADGISHITTRQDIQLHFVNIEDTPDLMRRLASVGITTREACGNSIRNVTACVRAGVCRGESFDVSPYAHAVAHYLLGHPDVQDFGRKFKIALSGCQHEACGLTGLHDGGLIAKTRVVDGQQERGFGVYIGGGLGAVPFQAKLLFEFVDEREILPTFQAISRVYARLGEKRNRARARVKFLVQKLGVEEFRRLVIEERESLPEDARWTAMIDATREWADDPLKPGAPLGEGNRPEGFEAWHRSNVYAQRQPNYSLVTLRVPLGDLTATQMRQLADLSRRFVNGSLRLSVEQNVVLRWVSNADLPALYQALRPLGLEMPGAGSIADITACPGTDTCKLGIASSRGLARELSRRLTAQYDELDSVVKELKIKISGCFNACGQHHVADIGFYGNSRTVGGYTVPHFQVVLGGQWNENAGAYGLAIGAVPSRRIPEVVQLVAERFRREREEGESFQQYIRRIGKKEVKSMLDDLKSVPGYQADRSFYSDWGDPREFSLGDIGVGECAGEVVSLTDFGLADAEREVFEAQVALDEHQFREAAERAYRSMVEAARGLIKTKNIDISSDPEVIVSDFRRDFHETGLFHDKYAGAKFASYLFKAHRSWAEVSSEESAHQLVEEAQLFIEAAHACYQRMQQRP